MNRKVIFILFIALATRASSQEFYKVSGKIMEATGKEPLAFSTISISGTTTGVVSNFLGVYEFEFSKEHSEDTLFVSMLGFKPKRIPIAGLSKNSTLDIQLEESVLMLDEVAVSEKKLSALDIVTKVIENIPNNYPVSPYLLKGFTRSHKHECGKYIKLYEADFEVYGGGYHKKTPEKTYINESRQSLEVPYYHSRVLRANSNPFHAMGHINDVLFKSNSLKLKYNKYQLDKFLEEDGELIYVIKTTHSRHVRHTMYINANNYALLKVKMEMTTPEGEDWNPLLNKGVSSDSLDFKVTQVVKTIQFEKQNDRYYTRYMDWLIEGNLSFQESKKEFCNWGFRFETMFDRVVTENVTKPSKEKLLNFRSPKEPKSSKYNPNFWEEYSLIKDFPISPEIIKDLETHGGLEKQFEQSGKEL